MANRIYSTILGAALALTPHAAFAQTAPNTQDSQGGQVAPIEVTGEASVSANVAPSPPVAPATAPPAPPTSAMTAPPPPMYAAGPSPLLFARRVVPYHGGPVPPYAHLETRPRTGLVIGGAAVFGVLWIGDAVAGLLYGSTGLLHSAGWLAVPVFGGLIWCATEPGLSGSGVAWGLMIVDSLLQAGGIVMFAVGMANRQPVLVLNSPQARRRPRPQWTLAPFAPGADVGASVVLRTF